MSKITSPWIAPTPALSDEAARLNTLIVQGRVVVNKMHGMSVLSMCLRQYIRSTDGDVEEGWIVPALEILDDAASDLSEWWDARLDAAENKTGEAD